MNYKEFEQQEGYKAEGATTIVNPTTEDKEVKWNGEAHVIKAGETKPFPNFIVRHFLKHVPGILLENEAKEIEAEKEAETEEVKEVKKVQKEVAKKAKPEKKAAPKKKTTKKTK